MRALAGTGSVMGKTLALVSPFGVKWMNRGGRGKGDCGLPGECIESRKALLHECLFAERVDLEEDRLAAACGRERNL